MSSVLLGLGIIIGGIVAIIYTTYRIIKGILYGVKGAGKKVIRCRKRK